MAGLPYPPELPAPATSTFTPAQRVRRLADPGRTVQAGREREFRGREQLTFVLTGDQPGNFDDWWRYEQDQGARLFSASWPLPSGFAVDAVRKFVTPPTWADLGGGNWRASVTSEVMGRHITLVGGFDARVASWPGTIEYAIRSGDLITDVTVPWTFDTPDITWDDYYGWSGFIGYVYTTSDLGAVRTTWARVTAAADQPLTIEAAGSADGTTWGAWVTLTSGAAPARFDARYVRIRIRVPNDETSGTAALTAARISIYQRT